METVVVSLIFFLVAQQIIFFYFIAQLQNKLMSRNFAEYATAKKELTKKEPEIKIPVTDEFTDLPLEDLGRVF